MAKALKYYFLFFIITFFVLTVQSQYLCDEEYKVFNKQKKKLKKKCKKQVKEWLLINEDLDIPKKLKFSKLKFIAEEKEENKWQAIDSLLCIKKDDEYIKEAKKRMLALKLVVYDIRAEFDYSNSTNLEIKSVLNFEFDFEGNMIRAVVRQKKMSPFSETPHH